MNVAKQQKHSSALQESKLANGNPFCCMFVKAPPVSYTCIFLVFTFDLCVVLYHKTPKFFKYLHVLPAVCLCRVLMEMDLMDQTQR
jgi:hypothetical protein